MKITPGDSLKATILKSDLPDLVQELGEFGVDSVLSEGVFRDLPILGTIHALCNSFGSIRDYLFTKKLLRFLKSMSELTPVQRTDLMSKIESEKGFSSYAGEKMIEVLSRLDEEVKAELVAKALKLYAEGKIDSSQLQRIWQAIERFLMCDVNALRDFVVLPGFFKTDDNPLTISFLSAGLGYVKSGYGGGGVHPTAMARLLVQLIDSGG